MRRSLHLQTYDYSQEGAYYVTFCTAKRICVLAEIVDGQSVPTSAGRIVVNEWEILSRRFPTIELDAMVVMPNHVHAIVVLGPDPERTGAMNRAATGSAVELSDLRNRLQHVDARFIAPVQPNDVRSGESARRSPILGQVIRHWKGAATYRIRSGGFRKFAWQPNYYDHVIRSESSLQRIREYIEGNPGRWAEDEENPQRILNH